MNTLRFTNLPGDGIGPEVMSVTLEVLESLGNQTGFSIETSAHDVGGIGIDNHGTALPESTLNACQNSDAILFGSVGGPKWENLPPQEQPERAALLPIRKAFELFANLRPGNLYPELADLSPLRPSTVSSGIDVLCVRELTGGIYFGQPKCTKNIENGEEQALDTMIYKTSEIERITEIAAKAAALRQKKICSVDKANVLETSVLWRKVVTACVERIDPTIELPHMYVDNAAMQIIRDPKQFDTMVTTNMFGDIISDAAAMMTGSLGMLPSASIGGLIGMYEPVHGSAPDITDQDKANPLAMILSAGMMMRYSFNLSEADEMIKKAVVDTLEKYRTIDIMAEGKIQIGCQEMGEKVLQTLEENNS